VTIQPGIHYSHELRPEWGTGVLAGTFDGKPRLIFTDGQMRTFRSIDGLVVAKASDVVEPVVAPRATEPKPRRMLEPKPKSNRFWRDAEETERLRSMVAAGETDEAIAAALGRTKQQVARRRNNLLLRTLSPNRRNNWAHEEDLKLIALVGEGLSFAAVGRVIGRSGRAVRSRHVKLDLDKRKRRWTAEEDARIVAFEGRLVELAEELGRSHRAIVWRRSELGVNVPRPEWTPEDVSTARTMLADGKMPSEIAAVVGKSAPAVRKKLRKLGAR
jgi:hypothetical protein